ncbi:MAG: Nif3-like dinuclear metal center hexameric protein [Bacteriovoracaceae bacterium]|nr:Nif3-like dinuclear metal center hexameric protein [Bacteriovoracaceae bacterium]
MKTSRQELQQFFNQLLSPEEFSDYGPNGLQIEGKEKIYKVAFAVSATMDSARQAVENNADALIVHHGLFWKFHGTRALTGSFAKRVFPLVKNDINLFGYHLPLDAHETVGNAASLASLIGVEKHLPFGDYKGSPTGRKGTFDTPISAKELKIKLSKILNKDILLSSPDEDKLIKSVGIITGGANSDWYLAMKDGLDAYITGEMSEHDWHESKEAGVHMFACGHHASEKFGIQSLMKQVQETYDVECIYIDSSNPA